MNCDVKGNFYRNICDLYANIKKNNFLAFHNILNSFYFFINSIIFGNWKLKTEK